MSLFSYIALDWEGRRLRGEIEAADEQAAADELRRQRLHILDVKRRMSPRLFKGTSRLAPKIKTLLQPPLNSHDRVQFLRQLCLMLRSGLPLLESLHVFAKQCRKTRLRTSTLRMADAINDGRSFSAALARERGLLPRLAVRMAAVGETTGELDIVLHRMADHIEHDAEVRGTMLAGMVYPAMLVTATVGVVVFLVGNVIPKFSRVLASRGMNLPAMTQRLVDVAEFLRIHGLTLLGGIAVAAILLALLSLIPRVRVCLDRFLLSLPLIGGLIRLTFLAHLSRTMALLLKSGLPVLDSLKILSASISNRFLGRRINNAADQVLLGKPLSDGLRCHAIPELLPEVIAVGEVTGTLDGALAELGDFFESSLRKRIKWVTTLFEPAMILVVGGIVAYVYISFFTVLYTVSTAHR